MKSHALWGSWPYVAFGVFAAGIFVQYLLARRSLEKITLQISEARAVFGGSRLWKLSFGFLLLAHLVGFLFPSQVLLWNRIPLRLYFLEALAFAAGCIALFCIVRMIWQHLGRPSRSAVRELADTGLLGLLLVAALSGVVIAAFYRWGSSWGPTTLAPYFLSLLRGSSAVRLAAQMPFLVQLHVFSFFAALMVLPFSRMARVLVFGMYRVVQLLGRPIAGVFDGLEVRIRRLNLASRVWPEED